MGIEYRAVMVLGLPYADFSTATQAQIDTEIDGGGIELVQPYFDAPREDSLVGIVLRHSGDYSWVCHEDNPIKIEEKHKAENKLIELFDGAEPKLYLSVQSW